MYSMENLNHSMIMIKSMKYAHTKMVNMKVNVNHGIKMYNNLKYVYTKMEKSTEYVNYGAKMESKMNYGCTRIMYYMSKKLSQDRRVFPFQKRQPEI